MDEDKLNEARKLARAAGCYVVVKGDTLLMYRRNTYGGPGVLSVRSKNLDRFLSQVKRATKTA